MAAANHPGLPRCAVCEEKPNLVQAFGWSTRIGTLSSIPGTSSLSIQTTPFFVTQIAATTLSKSCLCRGPSYYPVFAACCNQLMSLFQRATPAFCDCGRSRIVTSGPLRLETAVALPEGAALTYPGCRQFQPRAESRSSPSLTCWSPSSTPDGCRLKFRSERGRRRLQYDRRSTAGQFLFETGGL